MDLDTALTFDEEGLRALSPNKMQREWVDDVGAFLLLKLEEGVPPLPATLDAALEDFEHASEGRGRLDFVESLSVAGVRSVLYVVEMQFDTEALTQIGQTPSYSATLSVPFTDICVHFNAAYNRQLAELAPLPSGDTFATLDNPPDYLLALLRRVAASVILGGELAGKAPLYADG